MRKKLAGLVSVVVVATSCATVTDNISFEIDVEGIAATTCRQLADRLADQLVSAVAEIDASESFDLPEIDVAGLVDRADDLGCSPGDLADLVREQLATVEADTERARDWLDGVEGELPSG